MMHRKKWIALATTSFLAVGTPAIFGADKPNSSTSGLHTPNNDASTTGPGSPTAQPDSAVVGSNSKTRNRRHNQSPTTSLSKSSSSTGTLPAGNNGAFPTGVPSSRTTN